MPPEMADPQKKSLSTSVAIRNLVIQGQTTYTGVSSGFRNIGNAGFPLLGWGVADP